MASYRSPLDPIFFSHHATIDLLQTIYYDCKAGHGRSNEFKQTSTIAYHPWGGAPNSQSGFTVQDSSQIAQFFNALPSQYYQYVDATEIPNGFGYSYSLDSNFQSEIQSMQCTGGPPSVIDTTDAPTPSATDGPSAAPAPATDGRPDLPDPEDANKNVQNFYETIRDVCLSNGKDREMCKEETKNVECLCYDDLFGVEDFSDEFRQNFNISGQIFDMFRLCV